MDRIGNEVDKSEIEELRGRIVSLETMLAQEKASRATAECAILARISSLERKISCAESA